MKIYAAFSVIALNLVIANCGFWTEKNNGPRKQAVCYRKPQKLSTPEECARECKEDEEPLACYYHFTVEYYATLTQACALCRSTTTTGITPDCQCITADGYELSGIITANRQYPGPSIMVCKNDYVVIDVANHVTGNAITLHWHGIFQKGYQYYDGVPFITQCPIPDGSTFRYQWAAHNSGTHFWHAHTGLHKSEGLEGALIVREPRSNEPNNHLWDHDRKEDFIFIDDWFHKSASDHYPGTIVHDPGQAPDNFLINGKGQWKDPVSGNFTATPLAVFTVRAGQRYRFRLINGCSLACPVQMTIQGHNLTVIATDGLYLEPFNVTSITSFSAERYDFILHTNQKIGTYWIQFRGTGSCAIRGLQQVAILRYEEAATEPHLERPSYDAGLPAGIVLNPVNIRCNESPNSANAVCVNELKSANPVPPRVLQEPDLRIFLPITFYKYPLHDIFKVGTYDRFLVLGIPTTARVGNISNVFPSSPLLSQRQDTPDSQICSMANAPERCNGIDPCECVHIEDIPLNATVEFILVDEGHFRGLSHPFHMHGYAYYVMGEAHANDFGEEKMSLDLAKSLDKKGLIKRNLENPAMKDTYAVPNNGLAIIRVIANNPGYWLFHCHFTYHLEVGMSVILHVGEQKDLPPIPHGFPKCGNFVPTVYENSKR